MMIISNGKISGSWHVGEVMHVPKGRVITLQIDGHEFQAVFDALEKSGIEIEQNSEFLTPIY